MLRCSLILSCKLVNFAATQVSWKVFMKLSWKLPYKKWLFKKFSWKVLWKFHEKFTWKYHEQLHESIMNSFKKFSRKVGIFRGLFKKFSWKLFMKMLWYNLHDTIKEHCNRIFTVYVTKFLAIRIKETKFITRTISRFVTKLLVLNSTAWNLRSVIILVIALFLISRID